MAATNPSSISAAPATLTTLSSAATASATSTLSSSPSPCRFTRSGDTETGHGVYFGHENPHNVEGHIDEWDDFRPSPRREHGGQWDCSDDPEQPPCVVKHVIFKTDSRGLVETVEAARNGEDPLTRDFVWKGFVTYSPMQFVTNKDMWDVLVEKLTEMFNAGVAVEFWLVPLKRNEQAAALAEAGCDICTF